MLVLTRRKNQSIMIGDDIVVTVLDVKGDQIRLGITAPRHVKVYRAELLAAIQEANGTAAPGEGSAGSAGSEDGKDGKDAPGGSPDAPASILRLRVPLLSSLRRAA